MDPFNDLINLVAVGTASKEAKHSYPGKATQAVWGLMRLRYLGMNVNGVLTAEGTLAQKAEEWLAFQYGEAKAPQWAVLSQIL